MPHSPRATAMGGGVVAGLVHQDPQIAGRHFGSVVPVLDHGDAAHEHGAAGGGELPGHHGGAVFGVSAVIQVGGRDVGLG